MRCNDPQLRAALAAEYVLGTLSGPARRRFVRLLQQDAALRQDVAQWETRLGPLAAAVPEVPPPPRVWQGIAQRLPGAAPRRGLWSSIGLWRGLALANALAVAALALRLVLAPQPAAHEWVTVMSDARQNPAMVVTWPAQRTARKEVTIRVVQEHPQMAPDTSWELWLIPEPGGRPVSMGLVGIEAVQRLVLDENVSRILPKAWGMAMSVEPKHGSPTGAPTGEVLFIGPCVKISS